MLTSATKWPKDITAPAVLYKYSKHNSIKSIKYKYKISEFFYTASVNVKQSKLKKSWTLDINTVLK